MKTNKILKQVRNRIIFVEGNPNAVNLNIEAEAEAESSHRHWNLESKNRS